jgi:hypothetical protein
MFVSTKWSVNAKSRLVKGTFQSIRFGNVSKGTVFDFAPFPVPTQGHFTQIVLVQEFARRTLHAQITEPVPAHDGAEPRIVFGTRQDGFRCSGSSIIIVRIKIVMVLLIVIVVVVV